MECFSRIKDGNGRLVQGKDEVQRILKEYFEDMYNVNTQEQVSIHMCDFDGIRRGNYFIGESIERAEVEVRVGKLKNGKAVCKDEITGEMIKGGGDRRLCSMAFEIGVVSEDWRSAVIVHLYKGKGEKTECKNYIAC